MSDKKSWGSTVAGWFVVQDQPQQADKSGDYVPFSDDQAIKQAAAAQPPLDVFSSPPPAAPGGVSPPSRATQAGRLRASRRGRRRSTERSMYDLRSGAPLV